MPKILLQYVINITRLSLYYLPPFCHTKPWKSWCTLYFWYISVSTRPISRAEWLLCGMTGLSTQQQDRNLLENCL